MEPLELVLGNSACFGGRILYGLDDAGDAEWVSSASRHGGMSKVAAKGWTTACMMISKAAGTGG